MAIHAPSSGLLCINAQTQGFSEEHCGCFYQEQKKKKQFLPSLPPSPPLMSHDHTHPHIFIPKHIYMQKTL